MQEIASNPERLAYFLAIREAIGEGNDQYVDDMYSSNDGRLMIVSRPSFADVVAISLETGEIVWRFPVAGQRSDHMAISPDGQRGRGQRLDRQRRARAAGLRRQGARPVPVRRVAPRERLHRRRRADHPRQHRHGLHARSTSRRSTPPRASGCCQIVDADTYEVLRRYDLRTALDERGLRGLQHRRTPDDAVAERAEDLLPGLVLPRLPRDGPRHRQDPAGQAAAEPRPGHAARAVPPRLRPPRHRDEPGGHQDLRRRHDVRLRHRGGRATPTSAASC